MCADVVERLLRVMRAGGTKCYTFNPQLHTPQTVTLYPCVCRSLVSQGSDVNAKDIHGKAPADVAKISGECHEFAFMCLSLHERPHVIFKTKP